MSEAVIHGNTIYLAGQVEEGPDVATQTKKVLASIDAPSGARRQQQGETSSPPHLARGHQGFREMNSVWDQWVDKDNPPARATSEGKLGRSQFKVEIIVVAAKPDRRV